MQARSLYSLLASLLLLAILARPAAATDVVYLTTLEWPPYVGAALPGMGASASIIRQALATAGLETDVRFFPWKRAIAMAAKGQVHGYFPEYLDKSVSQRFLYSDVIGSSPLGFIEPANATVDWTSLDDLRGKVIGTVAGYVNTAEFDAKAAAGELTVAEAASDSSNIRKLAAGRLDMAVIDRNVYLYLMDASPELRGLQGKLRFNPRLLEEKNLYLCVPKGAGAEMLVRSFNEGLRRLDPLKVQAEYLDKVLRGR